MELFVSCPFNEAFDGVFDTIEAVARENSFTAYRVDQERFAIPIAETIEEEIRASQVVIADLTGGNPNVMNEVGQARTLGKPLILISQESPTTAPFNVRGLEILKYDRENLDGLREILSQAFSQASSPNEVLRSMLVPISLGRPTKDSKFVIAACPLAYRRAMGRVGGYKKLRRTSSDYVGLRGILQAFGLLYRFETLPDIVDPDDCDDHVIQERMNIYCIASPKANRWTSKLLRKYHETWVPRLDFRADPASKDLKNIKVALGPAPFSRTLLKRG